MDVAFTKRDTTVARLFWDAMFPGKALSHEWTHQALKLKIGPTSSEPILHPRAADEQGIDRPRLHHHEKVAALRMTATQGPP